jgi:hypothetical protein
MCGAKVARADIADQRTTELLQALQAGKFDEAEAHFDVRMRGGLPPDKLESVWNQLIARYGPLKSFEISQRTSTNGVDVRIADLHFERASGLSAQIAIDSAGRVAGLFFVPSKTAEPATNAPYIRPASFTSYEAKVGSGDDSLGATLTIPTGAGSFPGVVLVHGSGPNDRDENVAANHPFKDIAEGLSSTGIVVLRYDKRTYAHRGHLHPITVDAEVIDDAVAAVALLRRQPEVNRDKLFVLGHSLGAGLAPEIAARSDADGVVMLAPPGLPLPPTIVRQYRYLNVPAAKLAETEKTAHLIITKALPPDTLFVGVPASYYYDLASHDEVGFARKLGKPILILRGDRDYQVIDDDIAVWRDGLKGQSNVTIETLPRLNHLFIAGDGKPGPDEYTIPSYVAPEVIARVADFIKS